MHWYLSLWVHRLTRHTLTPTYKYQYSVLEPTKPHEQPYISKTRKDSMAFIKARIAKILGIHEFLLISSLCPLLVKLEINSLVQKKNEKDINLQ